MIGKDQDPEIGKPTQFMPGKSGNPLGKPKGRKSLSTIVHELEDEDFQWGLLPRAQYELVERTGCPWRAIVFAALIKSLKGDLRAAEWLRKISYGNNANADDLETEIEQPLIIPEIKPRTESI